MPTEEEEEEKEEEGGAGEKGHLEKTLAYAFSAKCFLPKTPLHSPHPWECGQLLALALVPGKLKHCICQPAGSSLDRSRPKQDIIL